MTGSRLVWWVFWRGLLLGAIQGALFGALIAFILGAIYGVVIGGLLGAGLGLVNGISLVFVTRSYEKSPHDTVGYLRSIRQEALPLDMLVVFVCSLPFVTFLAIIPAIIAAADVHYFSSGFRDYATGLTQPNNPFSLADETSEFTWLPKQQSKKRKTATLFGITVLVIFAAIWGIRAPMMTEKTRIPDRYLIPAGYTGEVKVYYHVASAPPLPIEDGHHLLLIPPDGVLKTSSDVEYGVASADDYYSYQPDEPRKRLLETEWGGGGMIWGDGFGSDNLGNIYSTLYVGTEAQYNQRYVSTPTHQPTANTLSPR